MRTVSIIVPLHNREKLIDATIESVLTQSHENLDIIVVDDGSTDQGPYRIEKRAEQDTRIRLIRRTKGPPGASACRNLGLAQAHGDYVLFLDSDDLLGEDCVQNRVKSLELDQELNLVIGQGLIFCDIPGDQTILWNSCRAAITNPVEMFLNQDMPWQTSGPLWRRRTVEAMGGWNANLRCFQDWELHLRACIENLSMGFIHQPDFFIRRSASADQISSSHNTPQHVESRILAFNTIINLLKSTQQLSGSIKNSAKGFLLRNHLSLHDAGCDEEAMMILQSEFGRKLLNPTDRWLLSWIRKQGRSWHWNNRVKRIANFWWRKIQYDALDMDTDFMKVEWDGEIPFMNDAAIKIDH